MISESAHEHNSTHFNNQDARVEEDDETPAKLQEDEASPDAVEQNE